MKRPVPAGIAKTPAVVKGLSTFALPDTTTAASRTSRSPTRRPGDVRAFTENDGRHRGARARRGCSARRLSRVRCGARATVAKTARGDGERDHGAWACAGLLFYG